MNSEPFGKSGMKNFLFIIVLLSLVAHVVAQQSGDKASSPAPSASPGKRAVTTDLSPCRTWAWQYSSMLVTLHPDGSVSTNSKMANAHWQWVDEPRRKLRIDWGNWLDQVTMAADHQSMRIVNNAGEIYTVHLLSAEPRESGPTFFSATIATSGSSSDTEPSPCGTWVWHGGSSLVTINPDGTVNQDGKEIKGIWHWLDEVKHKVRVDWISGWVDDATVAKDNTHMDVLNNAGDTFTVHRLARNPAAIAPSPTP
jgi:hypothetical protein